MPLTTVDNVKAILATSILLAIPDEDIYELLIADAAGVVSQYKLVRRGVSTADTVGVLQDENALFSNWVQVGAKVTNLTQGISSEVQSVTGDKEIMLASTQFVFSVGDRYEIEDLQRREKAERYKAASLIFQKYSPRAHGWDGVRLGPASISAGESLSGIKQSDLTLNPYEAEFRKIVGFTTEAV